jgi:mono/diheme cytochrome c family protein
MRALALLAFLAGCDSGSRVDDILTLTGDATNGAAVYEENCASCHAADGSGGIGPSMQGIVAEEGPEEVVDVILEGEDSMPSFSDLADQDIADVVAYLESAF